MLKSIHFEAEKNGPVTLPASLSLVLGRIIAAFSPEKIILFGSYSKGINHSASDIDLLVIADLKGDQSIHHRRARQLTTDCFPRVDITFGSPEEVASKNALKYPFLLSIIETGVILYNRG